MTEPSPVGDVGFLDRQFKREEQVKDLIAGIAAHRKEEIAEACDTVVVALQNSRRLTHAITVLLREQSRAHYHELAKNPALPAQPGRVGFLQGYIAALLAAEKLLTDRQTLASTKNSVLGA